MEQPFSLVEYLFYTAASTLPYFLSALVTFRGRLRFSPLKTAIASLAMGLGQITVHMLVLGTLYRWYILLDLASAVLYILFLLLLVRDHWGRLLSFLLALSHFSNLIVVAAKFLEGLFSMEMALQKYRYSYTLCVLAVEAVILPTVYFLVWKPFAATGALKGQSYLWRYLWLVPATFYLFWAYSFYGSYLPALQRALRPEYTMYLLCINAGSVLIYRLILRMINEQHERLHYAEKNHWLEVQTAQYSALQQRIDSARQARHDVKHHFTLLATMAQQGNTAGIADYIQAYQKTVFLDRPLTFCENMSANSVLLFYSQAAKKNGIRYEALCTLAEDTFLDKLDITVLLGNLLGNALEACQAQKEGERFISLKARPQSDSVFALVVRNSYEEEPSRDTAGHFFSRHHKGRGIGLESVKALAGKYHGTMEINTENKVFRVSVLLYKNTPPAAQKPL